MMRIIATVALLCGCLGGMARAEQDEAEVVALETSLEEAKALVADLTGKLERAKAQQENQTPMINPLEPPDEIAALKERVAALEQGKKDKVELNHEKCKKACSDIGWQWSQSNSSYNESRRADSAVNSYVTRAVPALGFIRVEEARQAEREFNSAQGSYEHACREVDKYCPRDQPGNHRGNRQATDFCTDYLRIVRATK